MASLVLGAIGASIPVVGPVLGVVGAAVGGVIDTLVINAIQRSQLPTPQPPDILRHSAADEGIGAPWIQGGDVRIPGAIIFLSEIGTDNIADRPKGKGPDHVEYEFTADIVIAWCRTETFGEVKKIWASGELIWVSGDQLITGNGFCAVIPTTEKDVFDTDDDSGGPLCPGDDGPAAERVTEERIRYEFLDPSQSFISQWNFIQANTLITMSGPSLLPANTGTFECSGTGCFTSAVSGLEVFVISVIKCRPQYASIDGDPDSFCIPIEGTGCSPGAEQLLELVTWEQTIDEPFSPYFEDIECYTGSCDQLPDELVMSIYFAEGEYPAFRGTTYCAIHRMILTKWAGTVPAFEAWVEETVGPKNIEDVITALAARAEGFDLDWLDVSELSSLAEPITTKGLFVIGPTPPSELINQLILLYDLELQESFVIPLSGVPQPRLRLIERANAQVISVPASDLGARAFGDVGKLGPQILRATKEDLPQELILDFIVTENSENLKTFPPGTTSYSVVQSSVRNQQKLTVSVTMLRTEADEIARMILWALILRHDRVVFEVAPSYTNLLPGDRAFLTLINGTVIQCRMVKVDRGNNGLIKVEAQLDDSSIYVQTGGTYSLPPDPAPVAFPPYMSPIILDLPPLTASQANTFGITVGVQTSQSKFPFPGGNLFSTPDDIVYTFESSFTIPAITARTDTRLQPALPYFWDFTNTILVVINGNATLSNATDLEVAAGKNWCLVGGEIFGFQTATLVDSNSYTLSGLIRGRRNTEAFAKTQSPDSALLILLDDGVTFFDLEPSAFNNNQTIRAVPSSEAVEDQTEFSDVSRRPKAQSLRPFSVHGVWSVRQQDSALCLWCTPRTRVPFRIFSGLSPLPFIEPQPKDDPESFKAIVFRANVTLDGWVEMRTISGCLSNNSQIAFSYTRKEQISDAELNGFDPNVPSEWLKFDIRRDSTSIGTGRLETFCMQGNGVKFQTADCSVIA